ncbi:MAG: DUF1841 family protein [Mariprofundales bacterium]
MSVLPYRQIFWEAWQRSLADLPLNALQQRIVLIIELHPEYHSLFIKRDSFLNADYQDNTGLNPQLHLSLHLAIEEQLATKQPPEAGEAMKHLRKQGKNRHDALHVLLELLAETVFNMQSNRNNQVTNIGANEMEMAAYRIRLQQLCVQKKN